MHALRVSETKPYRTEEANVAFVEAANPTRKTPCPPALV